MPRCVTTLSVHPALLRESRGRRKGKTVRDALKRAMTAAALWWKDEILPLHFKATNRDRYAGVFTPRTKSYMKRKMKGGHGRTDLVYTGRLRDTLIGRPAFVRNRVEATTLRITLNLPYAPVVNLWQNRKRGRGVPHDFPAEISAVNAAELSELRNRVERAVWDEFSALFDAHANPPLVWQEVS